MAATSYASSMLNKCAVSRNDSTSIGSQYNEQEYCKSEGACSKLQYKHVQTLYFCDLPKQERQQCGYETACKRNKMEHADQECSCELAVHYGCLDVEPVDYSTRNGDLKSPLSPMAPSNFILDVPTQKTPVGMSHDTPWMSSSGIVDAHMSSAYSKTADHQKPLFDTEYDITVDDREYHAELLKTMNLTELYDESMIIDEESIIYDKALKASMLHALNTMAPNSTVFDIINDTLPDLTSEFGHNTDFVGTNYALRMPAEERASDRMVYVMNGNDTTRITF